jgi:hypothetical protein
MRFARLLVAARSSDDAGGSVPSPREESPQRTLSVPSGCSQRGIVGVVIRWREAALLLCLCSLGAVIAARTVRLTTDPRRLDAHGERRWFEWAHREPYAATALARAAAELRPGEPVILIVPRTVRRPDWWRMIAAYHLPRHPVVGVFVRTLPRHPPEGTRVRVRRDGSFRVARSDVEGDG